MEVDVAAILIVSMLGTSFLSGIFGMMGGIVLMGLLLIWLPVPSAMILHGITQITANGWRAWLWRKHVLRSVLPGYLIGSLLVFALFSVSSFSPPKPWVLLGLGLIPFAARAAPARLALDIRKKGTPSMVGAAIMALHVVAGVAGPLLDVFFLSRDLDRRLVVATKAVTQTAGHVLKVLYFGAIGLAMPTQVDSLPPIWVYPFAMASAVVGTSLAKPVLARFPNDVFQTWSRRLVLVIGAFYLWRGVEALLNGGSAASP